MKKENYADINEKENYADNNRHFSWKISLLRKRIERPRGVKKFAG